MKSICLSENLIISLEKKTGVQANSHTELVQNECNKQTKKIDFRNFVSAL